MTLSNLNKSIIHCRKCERLVNFREKIAKEKENNILIKVIGVSPLLAMEMKKQNY